MNNNELLYSGVLIVSGLLQVFIILIRSTIVGYAFSSSAPLLPPPSFSNSTFVLSAFIYGNITLTYNIGTNDSVLSVWWWKNGVLILPTDQHYESTLVGTVASLFIDDLTIQDSDLYQVLVLTSTVSRYDFSGEIGNFDLTVRGMFNII